MRRWESRKVGRCEGGKVRGRLLSHFCFLFSVFCFFFRAFCFFGGGLRLRDEGQSFDGGRGGGCAGAGPGPGAFGNGFAGEDGFAPGTGLPADFGVHLARVTRQARFDPAPEEERGAKQNKENPMLFHQERQAEAEPGEGGEEGGKVGR